MSDNVSRGQQAAEEVARRWISAMQAMGDQIQRQQQTFQEMSQRWVEQAQQQQQVFGQMVRQSLTAYTDIFKPPS